VTVRVPMVDLGPQHAALRPELEQAFGEVLTSSQFVLGAEVERFEGAAAAYLGARHAVGVSSGTDALLVALMALGVGPGDEVVTTPFSFFATVGSILRLGARPRFVDVDPATLNLDVARIEEAITERTRAVVPVHLYGNPARLDAIAAVTARHGIPVVEDAAQAFGARYGDRAAGTWGKLGCFSFFPTKILGALGDAGLVVTDDGNLAARCRRLRQHGAERRGEYVEVGGNFRLDAMQAAALRVKLRHAGEWIAARRAHGAAYDAAFHGLSGLEALARGEGWNGSIYVVRVLGGRREALRTHLGERGVETAVYYDRPLHLQPVLAHLGIGPGAFPESERAAGEVLSLPIFSDMTAAQRDLVIDATRAFFR
jgi:dTDP-4-amino-4,6-dideoxygalactose transaminase